MQRIDWSHFCVAHFEETLPFFQKLWNFKELQPMQSVACFSIFAYKEYKK